MRHVKRSLLRLTIFALVFPLLSACSTSAERPPATAPAPAPSALEKLADHGRIAVSAQPTAQDLQTLAAQGYTHIVSVRTQAEMDDRKAVPFDEPVLAAELALQFQLLPVGGDQPFRPELADGLALALQDPQAKVLLHCASGARASQVYAAYAVKYLGMEPDAALRQTEAFGAWPLPLERMTGIRLKVVRAEE